MKFLIRLFSFFTFLLLDVQVHLGECKTVGQSKWRVEEGRGMEGFVDFTGESDQLAMESTVTESSFGKKREILGKKKEINSEQVEKGLALEIASGSRQCPNVNKVIYPVIPVIIASLIGLIGSIIISYIARGIYRLIKGSHEDDLDSGYGYERQIGLSNILGFDLRKVDFLGVTKRVLHAIEKIY